MTDRTCKYCGGPSAGKFCSPECMDRQAAKQEHEFKQARGRRR